MKIKRTIEQEIEVKFPCYRKSECHYFKFLSEEKAIQLTILEGHYSIQERNLGDHFGDTYIDSDDCSEEEFLKAYREALKQIEKKILPEIEYVDFRIVDDSICITELVDGEPGREFKIRTVNNFLPSGFIESAVRLIVREELDEDVFYDELIEKYAMKHKDKWEEVQP